PPLLDRIVKVNLAASVLPNRPAVDHIVRRCLRKDPDERWQTAADLKHELSWLHESVASNGATARIPARSQRRLAAVRLLAAGLAVLLIVGGIVTGRIPGFWNRSPTAGS